MAKKLIAFLSILSLFLSIPLLPANAAAKAGAKCTQAGNTEVVLGKKYTCIKTGKKLVWNKGASQSPGKNMDAREQAYNSVRLIYNANKDYSPKNDIQIISHSSVKQSEVSEIGNRTTNVLKFFGDEAASINFHIVIGDNENTAWMVQEFTKADPANAGGHAEWGAWFKGNLNSGNRCKLSNAGSMGTSDGSALLQFTLYPNDCTNPRDIVWKTIVEHEVVGHMQRVWSEKRDELLPCWLNEGQQVYYGSVLGTAKNFSEFKEVFSWHKRFKKEDLMTAAKRLGTGFSGVACGSQEGGYEAGRLLVEQLIYQFGHEALLSFTKAIVNTPGQDSEKWKVAFEKQFKISYDEWLEKVVPEIEKREL
ncbi:hypothetical protein [Candidatus Planktophila versatilis]|uniref:DUF1570 domain-containing protein n=1 Tax=Candidatus Planktophila versatilis TaxID=1884905 RepID=A0ABM6MDL4_9ACTN|nr:hypothetical protein [Candidatus Planktophila versatilis]ASY16803.1 hypothetical protein A1sIA79_00770 [Candidatus Planktophila versatilis]